MVQVNFVKPNGESNTLDLDTGQSLMQAAIYHGVDEILGDCGGCLSCATCHVHISPEWVARVGTASEEERAMLEMAIDPDEYSRLSCQIDLDESLDGLTVRLPASQL